MSTTANQRIDVGALRNDDAVLTAEPATFHNREIDYPIDRIVVGERHRPLGDVSALAESMSNPNLGQLQAIVLLPDGRLVIGNHRVAAARLLGWRTIRATIKELDELDAELAEIDENLRRSELTVLEQGDHLDRREQILAARGQRAQPGHNQHNGGGDTVTPPPVTTAAIAGDMGISERSAQRRLQIARGLDATVKRRIAGTNIANSTSQLLELARMKVSDQQTAVEMVLAGGFSSVQHAAAVLALDPDAWRLLKPTVLRDNPTELAELGRLEPQRQRKIAALLVDGKAHSVRHGVALTQEPAKTFLQVPASKPTFLSVEEVKANLLPLLEGQSGRTVWECAAGYKPTEFGTYQERLMPLGRVRQHELIKALYQIAGERGIGLTGKAIDGSYVLPTWVTQTDDANNPPQPATAPPQGDSADSLTTPPDDAPDDYGVDLTWDLRPDLRADGWTQRVSPAGEMVANHPQYGQLLDREFDGNLVSMHRKMAALTGGETTDEPEEDQPLDERPTHAGEIAIAYNARRAEHGDAWAAAVGALGTKAQRAGYLAIAITPWILEYKDKYDRTWRDLAAHGNPSHSNSTFWDDIRREIAARKLMISDGVLKMAIKRAFEMLEASAMERNEVDPAGVQKVQPVNIADVTRLAAAIERVLHGRERDEIDAILSDLHDGPYYYRDAVLCYTDDCEDIHAWRYAVAGVRNGIMHGIVRPHAAQPISVEEPDAEPAGGESGATAPELPAINYVPAVPSDLASRWMLKRENGQYWMTDGFHATPKCDTPDAAFGEARKQQAVWQVAVPAAANTPASDPAAEELAAQSATPPVPPDLSAIGWELRGTAYGRYYLVNAHTGQNTRSCASAEQAFEVARRLARPQQNGDSSAAPDAARSTWAYWEAQGWRLVRDSKANTLAGVHDATTLATPLLISEAGVIHWLSSSGELTEANYRVATKQPPSPADERNARIKAMIETLTAARELIADYEKTTGIYSHSGNLRQAVRPMIEMLERNLTKREEVQP